MSSRPLPSALLIGFANQDPSTQQQDHAERIEAIEYTIEQELAFLRLVDAQRQQNTHILALLFTLRDDQLRLREHVERLTSIIGG